MNTDELLRLIETILDECVEMVDLKEQLEERIRKTTENFSVYYSDKFVGKPHRDEIISCLIASSRQKLTQSKYCTSLFLYRSSYVKQI